jgi:hypothetical protein
VFFKIQHLDHFLLLNYDTIFSARSEMRVHMHIFSFTPIKSSKCSKVFSNGNPYTAYVIALLKAVTSPMREMKQAQVAVTL